MNSKRTVYFIFITILIDSVGMIYPIMVSILKKVTGWLTAFMSFTSVISPFIVSYLVYAFTSENAPFFFPGAPFLAAAVLVIGAFLIYLSQSRKAG